VLKVKNAFFDMPYLNHYIRENNGALNHNSATSAMTEMVTGKS